MRRPKITIRRLMIAVALAAVFLAIAEKEIRRIYYLNLSGIERRRTWEAWQELKRTADTIEREANIGGPWMVVPDRSGFDRAQARFDDHRRRTIEYEAAAARIRPLTPSDAKYIPSYRGR